MKETKFVAFADLTNDCAGVDNFIKHDLELTYFSDGNEYAIGLTSSHASRIQVFDDKFDVFLFTDAVRPPNSDELFFSKFLKIFFQNKDEYEFRLILHAGSEWKFSNIDTADGSDHSELREEIAWLSNREITGDLIYQSHAADSVYCKELKQIAQAIISKNRSSYDIGLQQLDDRFINKGLEELLKPFVKADPFKEDPYLAATIGALEDRAKEIIASRQSQR